MTINVLTSVAITIALIPITSLVLAHMVATRTKDFVRSFVYASTALVLGASVTTILSLLGFNTVIGAVFGFFTTFLPSAAGVALTASATSITGILLTEFLGFKEAPQVKIVLWFLAFTIVAGLVFSGVLAAAATTVQSLVGA